ncbi:hypothetical protein DIPPA_33989 [Diplonema papillatum]|nr:hypothetical protein DIPPA_33989 [Diplonema papillatum]
MEGPYLVPDRRRGSAASVRSRSPLRPVQLLNDDFDCAGWTPEAAQPECGAAPPPNKRADDGALSGRGRPRRSPQPKCPPTEPRHPEATLRPAFSIWAPTGRPPSFITAPPAGPLPLAPSGLQRPKPGSDRLQGAKPGSDRAGVAVGAYPFQARDLPAPTATTTSSSSSGGSPTQPHAGGVRSAADWLDLRRSGDAQRCGDAWRKALIKTPLPHPQQPQGRRGGAVVGAGDDAYHAESTLSSIAMSLDRLNTDLRTKLVVFSSPDKRTHTPPVLGHGIVPGRQPAHLSPPHHHQLHQHQQQQQQYCAARPGHATPPRQTPFAAGVPDITAGSPLFSPASSHTSPVHNVFVADQLKALRAQL